VTSKTEGKAFADSTGVPLLVKYDTRLREGVAKGIVQEVTSNIQVHLLSHLGGCNDIEAAHNITIVHIQFLAASVDIRQVSSMLGCSCCVFAAALHLPA
jgi:hypothetical protein